MSRPCKSVAEIVEEVSRIVKSVGGFKPDFNDYIFFRGESMNYATQDDREIGTSFMPKLYREENWRQNEREIFENALRINVADFTEDMTLTERLARMQHYQLPTRICDMTDNALIAAHFASDMKDNCRERDGFIRVIQVSHDKMKSFTSDIIVAASHLVRLRDEQFIGEGGLETLAYEVCNERPGWLKEQDRTRKLNPDLERELGQVWAFQPIFNSRRIVRQGGAFLMFGCKERKQNLVATFSDADYESKSAATYGIRQLGVVRIGSQAKPCVKEELRRFGVLDELVYPELHEACASIAQRFKNRKELSYGIHD